MRLGWYIHLRADAKVYLDVETSDQIQSTRLSYASCPSHEARVGILGYVFSSITPVELDTRESDQKHYS